MPWEQYEWTEEVQKTTFYPGGGPLSDDGVWTEEKFGKARIRVVGEDEYRARLRERTGLPRIYRVSSVLILACIILCFVSLFSCAVSLLLPETYSFENLDHQEQLDHLEQSADSLISRVLLYSAYSGVIFFPGFFLLLGLREFLVPIVEKRIDRRARRTALVRSGGLSREDATRLMAEVDDRQYNEGDDVIQPWAKPLYRARMLWDVEVLLAETETVLETRTRDVWVEEPPPPRGPPPRPTQGSPWGD